MCARLRLRRHLIQARHESEEPGATTWKADDDQKTKSMMMREVTRHSSSEVGWATSVLRRRTADGEKEKSEAACVAWRGWRHAGKKLSRGEIARGKSQGLRREKLVDFSRFLRFSDFWKISRFQFRVQTSLREGGFQSPSSSEPLPS